MKIPAERIPKAAVKAFERAYEKEWDRVADESEGRIASWNGGADRAATIAGIAAAVNVMFVAAGCIKGVNSRGDFVAMREAGFVPMSNQPLYTINNGDKQG